MEFVVPMLVLVGVAAILYAAMRPRPVKPVPADEAITDAAAPTEAP